MKIRARATAIVRRLQKAGFTAFWVGGCVRDFLLGREPDDYDIVTSALPSDVERLFKRTLAVGRKFGVVIVLEGGCEFQVATFRAEADYRDGRHPDRVTFGDARADALRRDFTINGLFYDPLKRQLHDWVGGETDLRNKVVRTIGEPAERFAEDHLRLLRAVRFAVQLDFQIESGTFDAIRAQAGKMSAVSAERIRDELLKVFSPPRAAAREAGRPSREAAKAASFPHAAPLTGAARGLELLRASGLLKPILPEIDATVACEQSPGYHPEGTVFNHLVLMLRHVRPGADPLLPWAVLLHDVAKPITASTDPNDGSIHFYEHEKIGAEMAERILERLRFPRKSIEIVTKAVRCHMQFKDAMEMRQSTVRRLLMRPTFPLELELHRLDCLGSHGRLDIYDYLVRESKELEKLPEIRPPLLTGNDLKGLGMQPGPEMGRLLAEVREKQLQGELKTSAQAREWAVSVLKQS